MLKVKKFNVFYEKFEERFNTWAESVIVVDKMWCQDQEGKSTLVVFYNEPEGTYYSDNGRYGG
jgi:hypothetical protein